MRKRWLFILLCAILVHLIGCEYSVDENGYSSETISSDPSATLVFHGDETVYRSEFMSEPPKIRRSRSTPIDEYNSALIEQKLANETQINAAKAREDATAVLNKAIKELEDAEKEWKKLDDKLTENNRILADGETNKQKKDLAEAAKKPEYERAKSEYERVLALWTPLDKAANDAYDAYKKKNDALDVMEKEGSELALARQAALDAAEEVTSATDELVGLQEELTNADNALTKATTDSENNKKTIEDYKNYGTSKTQRDEFKKSKDKFTEQLRKSTEDTTLDKKKKVVENNMILENHIRLPFLHTMTFTEGLNHCKESQLPNSAMNENDKTTCGIAIIYLEQLEPYYGTENVKKCIDDYAKLKLNVDEEIRLKKLDESYLKGNETASEEDRKTAETGMKTILKQYGDDFQKLKSAESSAKNSKTTIDNSYKTALTRQAECAGKVTTKTDEIGTLTTASNQANAALTPLQTARDTLAGEVSPLKTTWETERGKADDNKRDHVDPAKKIMDKKYGEYEGAQYEAIRADHDLRNAKQDIPTLTLKVNDAKKLVGEKKTAKKIADEADGKAKENEQVALLAAKTADTNVREKREAKEEYEKTEAARQSNNRTAYIGVGAGVVLIALIGGVLAFVLIKKNKKKKEAKAKAKAPKRKTKETDESGIDKVTQPDGESNLQVAGDKSIVDDTPRQTPDDYFANSPNTPSSKPATSPCGEKKTEM